MQLNGITIYVASSFLRRDVANFIATSLREAGAKVNSRWLYVELSDDDGDAQVQYAQMDLEDVADADVVVCLTGDKLTRGGRHSEVGMALITSKNVFLLGPREQVFHYHPLVSEHESMKQIVAALGRWKVKKEKATA